MLHLSGTFHSGDIEKLPIIEEGNTDRQKMENIFVEWKNHHEEFRYSLMERRRSGDFCDVTLMCEDGDILAHQIVLSAGSSVFNRMLNAAIFTKKVEQKVQLKGICVTELNLILDYIYKGHYVIPKSDIDNFFKKGTLLGLIGIQKRTEETDQINRN